MRQHKARQYLCSSRHSPYSRRTLTSPAPLWLVSTYSTRRILDGPSLNPARTWGWHTLLCGVPFTSPGNDCITYVTWSRQLLASTNLITGFIRALNSISYYWIQFCAIMLKIAMPATRKVCRYAAQLTNKVANYRIQVPIQGTASVQACRFLNRQNWRYTRRTVTADLRHRGGGILQRRPREATATPTVLGEDE